jgi:hypothetical protein
VPRNGGPWFDILDEKQGKYGYCYRNLDEAARLVDKLLLNNILRLEVSARAQQRTEIFDSSVFENNIARIVERTYSRMAK